MARTSFHYIPHWSQVFSFSLQIRNAFFNAVSSACKFNATVLGNYAAVVCPTVLSCLDESDPTVVGSLWECVLHIVNTFEVGFLYHRIF